MLYKQKREYQQIGPFMDTGYFNILQQTDTEYKEKASENQKISEAFVELMNPLVIRVEPDNIVVTK